jgi:hypothetical protein
MCQVFALLYLAEVIKRKKQNRAEEEPMRRTLRKRSPDETFTTHSPAKAILPQDRP